MKSIECQIQEHDFGDFFLVGGTTIDVNGKTAKSRVVKTTDAEKPFSEWNVVEVVCDGDTITNSAPRGANKVDEFEGGKDK